MQRVRDVYETLVQLCLSVWKDATHSVSSICRIRNWYQSDKYTFNYFLNMKWLGNCFFLSNRRIFEIEAYSRGRERVPVGNIIQN